MLAAAVQGCAYDGTMIGRPTYDVGSTTSRRPPCNAAIEIHHFMAVKKDALDSKAKLAGFITTPLKYISTGFDGFAAWRDTGCNASGVGIPVRTAQHSTDGLYTVDVALRSAEVNGFKVPLPAFVRLEVKPGRPAHASMRERLPQPTDVIRFSGPLVWDKDKDCPHHCDGHMEIHPFERIEFVGSR
jgi:hypothetical protein